MPGSIAGRLLALLVGLLGAALLASTVAALRAANANVTALVSSELEVRERVVTFALAQQAETLRERVDIITADFAFKAAVASKDRGTVLSALANHGDRLNADLAILLTPDGEISLSSAPLEILPPALNTRINKSAPGTHTALEVVAGHPYQLVLSPVSAPSLIGWLIIGEELDGPTLEALARLTNADISLLMSDDGENSLRIVSTLARARARDRDIGTATALSAALRESGWLSREVTLTAATSPGGTPIQALLSLSLDDALADYNPLRLQLIAIALVALLLAVALAVGASRWITRPVTAMVEAARRIADGEYTYAVQLKSGTELDTLAEALSFMQDTVAEREARIQHQAQHDLLTQLPNRNYMYTLYQRYLREHPERASFGIAMMEIENLPQLRDLYGSDFSDQVLRAVSKRTTESLRRGDMAGRVGDQQILLFLQGLGASDLDQVMDKIGEQSDKELVVAGVPVRSELRLGFALSPAHGLDFDDLQRRAQLALTQARRQGDLYALYSLGQDESHLRQIRIANRLQDAVRDDAFHLLYQPKYSLSERRICGAEALLRWEDAELGRVFPDEFITIAEQTGIITQLSEWVVAQVIRDQQHWRRNGTDTAISVNLSGLDVLQADFIDRILADVHAAGLPVDAIVLEVTETAMMADADAARANMERVEKLGMRISIDDYGTGFSSLAQLRALPVRELKLDRSLIANIDSEVGDRLIVRSTIEMAHHLGLEVVAEGVETPAILALLSDMHCDVVQGYLLARPMPAEALAEFLSNQPASTALLRDTLIEND
jgi:diguanylate cyclase (GGDEF)-like protein